MPELSWKLNLGLIVFCSQDLRPWHKETLKNYFLNFYQANNHWKQTSPNCFLPQSPYYYDIRQESKAINCKPFTSFHFQTCCSIFPQCAGCRPRQCLLALCLYDNKEQRAESRERLEARPGQSVATSWAVLVCPRDSCWDIPAHTNLLGTSSSL